MHKPNPLPINIRYRQKSDKQQVIPVISRIHLGASGNWYFLSAKAGRFTDLVNAEECIKGSQHQSAATCAGSSIGVEESGNASTESGELAQRVCNELRQEFMVGEEPLWRDRFVEWSPGPKPELWLSGYNATNISCVSHQLCTFPHSAAG